MDPYSDGYLPAMEVISLTNFNNFITGYLTVKELKECKFVVPQVFATSPQKELVKVSDASRIIQKDN